MSRSLSYEKRFLEFFRKKDSDPQYKDLEKNYRYSVIIREWREKEKAKKSGKKSTRRSRSSKGRRRSVKKSSRVHKRSAGYHLGSKKSRARRSGKCKSLLKKKIGINMQEYKSGRFSSPAQAIAVSYSQVKKSNPRCAKYLKK